MKYGENAHSPEGVKTKEFAVLLNDKGGGLAELTDTLGNSGINIITLTMSSSRNSRQVRLITSDELTCRDMLNHSKYEFTEDEIITVVIDDKPGSLAKILKKLDKSRVKVNSTYIINKKDGRVEFVLGLDNPEEGKKLLFRKLGLDSTLQAVND
ncbi:MAG: hypothetical protein KIY11_01595 [Thermoplasmata archaeon]|nr:hypothetical protein [Candidatus Sysuiplasma acidicola]